LLFLIAIVAALVFAVIAGVHAFQQLDSQVAAAVVVASATVIPNPFFVLNFK